MKVEADYGEWRIKADEENYSITNPGEDGKDRFYMVDKGPYGNPVITAEPDLAFKAPQGVDYVDAKGDKTEPVEKIAGIICKKLGEVVHRFSLSSPNAPEYTLEEGGAELIIDGVRWHLRALFRKDKNRIINYDAWYGTVKPDSVLIVELEDLDF